MKPSERINEIASGLDYEDAAIKHHHTRPLFMNTIKAIIQLLDESQEPKALEEKEEWTHNLAAREMKRDYPEETAGFNLDQIAEMYAEWSEENYCAGWMAPCKEYVERCFKAKPQVLEGNIIGEPIPCKGHVESGQLVYFERCSTCEPQYCPECHYPKGEAHARRCSLRRGGLVGEEPCHQESETEVRSKCGDGDCVAVHGYDCQNSIILPRPKGMSIAETWMEFVDWHYKRGIVGKATIISLTDGELLQGWSQFRKSLEK